MTIKQIRELKASNEVTQIDMGGFEDEGMDIYDESVPEETNTATPIMNAPLADELKNINRVNTVSFKNLEELKEFLNSPDELLEVIEDTFLDCNESGGKPLNPRICIDIEG